MFPTTGFQIITELSSPEDPPCLGRTSYPTDACTVVCFGRRCNFYFQISFAARQLARQAKELPVQGSSPRWNPCVCEGYSYLGCIHCI